MAIETCERLPSCLPHKSFGTPLGVCISDKSYASFWNPSKEGTNSIQSRCVRVTNQSLKQIAVAAYTKRQGTAQAFNEKLVAGHLATAHDDATYVSCWDKGLLSEKGIHQYDERSETSPPMTSMGVGSC